MKGNIEQVGLSNRIQSLDVLRGLSLLGILVINMISFHSPFGYYNPYEWWQYGDLAVFTWLDIFVQASFYPIFAMIFGYGMVIMQKRSALKGISFYKISIRRLIVLLVIGILHAFFVWHGDILITYAIMGLVLLLLMKLSGTMLMTIGAVVYIIPQLFLSGMLVIISMIDVSALGDFTDIVALQQAETTYATGTFWEITQQRFIDWSVNNNIGGFIVYLIMILPLMMIGAGAAKKQWLEKANKQKKGWAILLVITLPIGLLIKMLPFYIEPSMSLQYVQDMLGGPILSFAYIAIAVLLMTNKYVVQILKPLASAGRMSITIYLTQSIVGTFIFYQYGLGLYGEMSMQTGTLLAITIFIIQVILAEIWLWKFKQGPVEKVWRLLTYGRTKIKGVEEK